MRRRAGVRRVGKGCGGGKENEGRKGKGRRGEGGEAGSGAQPLRYFLKCVFTLSPGLAESSRLRFWTPLAEISLLMKFEQDRGPAGRLHKTWPPLPYGGLACELAAPLASHRAGAHVPRAAEIFKICHQLLPPKKLLLFYRATQTQPGGSGVARGLLDALLFSGVAI